MVVRPHIPYSGGPEELMMAAHDPLAHDREDSVVATKRAVLYLRVSTPSQVNTDYNPEGISLPAQREACEPKASALDAEIIREFVEPGRSAATIDKRPVFQEMLAWIKEQGDIDYVIVYHFNRIFRNSIDAALTKRDLRKLGVRVVSTILDLGDGPEGDMVETILNAVDEYRSRADGADISYKMGAKARNGGTLGRAPLGYLNIRDTSEGRNIGTVEIDPERGPLVRSAFELYATGDFSLESLADELTQRGLRTRPGRFPSGPISNSKLHVMLRDRYYVGYITYKEDEFAGRHPKLIGEELFERVQDILDERGGIGMRKRRHHHYLKGSLWCGRCHEAGREYRMILTWITGRRGGRYPYFYCRGRQERDCDTSYVNVDAVEDAVLKFWGTLQLAPELIDGIKALLDETLSEKEHATTLLHEQLSAELIRLDTQEENLLDLVADGRGDSDKVKSRLRDIQHKRQKLTRQLDEGDERLNSATEFVASAAELLRDPQELYRQCGPEQRKMLNQAVFEKFYIVQEDVTDAVLKPPFDELIGVKKRWEANGAGEPVVKRIGREDTPIPTLANAFFDGGSNKGVMVEVMRLCSNPSWPVDLGLCSTKA
jgi:site-specific DNA recombinase